MLPLGKLFHVLTLKLSNGPKHVLSLCASLLVQVAVLLELGWDVVTVYVVESEDLQRRVAKANFGDLL